MCILITFSLSVMLICLMDAVEREKNTRTWAKLFAGTMLVFFLCTVLPDLLTATDYQIDYGLMGVFLPLLIYGAGNAGLVLGLVLLALQIGGVSGRRQTLFYLGLQLLCKSK